MSLNSNKVIEIIETYVKALSLFRNFLPNNEKLDEALGYYLSLYFAGEDFIPLDNFPKLLMHEQLSYIFDTLAQKRILFRTDSIWLEKNKYKLEITPIMQEKRIVYFEIGLTPGELDHKYNQLIVKELEKC